MSRFTTFLIAFFWSALVAADSFHVEDIRVDGLQRISHGAVFRAFGIEVGDSVNDQQLAEASRRLFQTSYFNDIQLLRDDNVLVIRVTERPSISQIKIEGNDAIETEALLNGLSSLGLSEGEVFQRATLEKIRLELSRIYAAQGRYNSWIDLTVEDLPENRIGVNVVIKEGEAASIQHINIVGNTVFTDEELREQFDLSTPGFWSFFFKDDHYKREKFGGDLERLRSYYLNRGYINFKIDSTQVSITPDRKHVYITINVTEGDIYRFGSFELAGDLVVPEDELVHEVQLVEGEVFSRELAINSTTAISDRLGNDGYLRANVNPRYDVDEETKTVDITFVVDPGNRMYVRRIEFRGNKTSSDEVLRREMRQMEASWAASDKIEASKVRLDRLGYFSSVNVNTKPVAGTEDQVDLEYSVAEQLSGSLTASIGFSQSSGIILAGKVAQKNFLGTGKQVSVGMNTSKTDTEYSFSYNDPYYTVDGVSRGFDAYFLQQDFDEDDVSNYNLDTFGFNVNFGYPINEYQRLRFSAGYENTEVKLNDDIPEEITSFISEEGDSYNQFTGSLSWTDNHLNKGLLASAGYKQAVTLEFSLPGSSLNYYKLNYEGNRYFPLAGDWILNLRGGLGYAGSYGDTSSMPFYKNFFSGGLGSVRGFKNNSLGPRANNDDEDPLGGDIQVEGSVELIFPFPFGDDDGKLRSLVFFDIGNVFESDCLDSNPNCSSGFEYDEMRSSVGIGVSWLTFIGPLSFSIATPVTSESGDETESFQFALGRTF